MTGLIYDNNIHRWYLDKSYVLSEKGIDLDEIVRDPFVSSDQAAVTNFLKDISNQVYRYIYSCNLRYRDYLEYLLATDEDAEFNLREAMLLQLRYVIRNGKINELAGVNMTYTTDKAYLPSEAFRGDRAIHPEAIEILQEPLHSTGVSLIYGGIYDFVPNFTYRSGY